MRRIARLLLAAVFTAAAGAAEKPPVRDLSGEAKHVVAAARPGFFLRLARQRRNLGVGE